MSDRRSGRDRRVADRADTDDVIRVTDNLNGRDLGHIGNISAEGLMLITQLELARGALLQLSFELAGRTLTPTVECVWTSPAGVEGTWWSGMHFNDMPAEDADHISTFVEQNM